MIGLRGEQTKPSFWAGVRGLGASLGARLFFGLGEWVCEPIFIPYQNIFIACTRCKKIKLEINQISNIFVVENYNNR